MKILHIVPTLGYGGVAKVVTNYYEQMNHEQFRFDIITHGGEEDYHKALVEDGSRIYYFQTLGKVGVKAYRRQIRENIDLSEYDIVHIHVGHLTGLYAMLFKNLGAKKIICHAHTTRCVNKKQAKLMPLWRFLANHYADERIACGHDAGEFCFGHNHYTVLANGISFEKIDSISESEIIKLKEELGIKKGKFIVGHVGAFSSPKNHVFLADIIHDFLKKNDNAIFVLIGDGPLKAEIENKVKQNGDTDSVIFTGIRNDVYTCMKMFDVFVLPSLHEGLPVVGIEAQAAGIPCLFSENIDKTVDIKADLVEFLPIDKGTECWVESLEKDYNANENKDKDMGKVFSCLKTSGYEITESSKILKNIYRSLVS